jgi:hypothetical protein
MLLARQMSDPNVHEYGLQCARDDNSGTSTC